MFLHCYRRCLSLRYLTQLLTTALLIFVGVQYLTTKIENNLKLTSLLPRNPPNLSLYKKSEPVCSDLVNGELSAGGGQRVSRDEVQCLGLMASYPPGPDVNIDLVTTNNSTSQEGAADHFQDQFFATMLKTFQMASEDSFGDTILRNFRSGSIPKVFIYIYELLVNIKWLKYHTVDMEQNLCPLPCHVTTNLSELKTADAVMIHLRSVESPEKVLHDLGPRDPSQPWIMFETETHLLGNDIYHTQYKALDSFFNRTMHYRQDSDIMLFHGFIVHRGKDANFLPLPWRREPILQPHSNRSKLAVAFISNCKANSGRLEYIKALKNHIPVDVYGKCGDLECGSSHYTQHNYKPESDPCMKMAGENYLFYLSFENALCKDYVTEKLYNLLFYPMVPVVLGGADYTSVMPPNSYINALHYTPQQLAKKLTYLAAHPKEYLKLLKWRKYYQPSTIGGSRILCDVCVKLHDPLFYEQKVIEDFYEWFVTRANCNGTRTVHHPFKWL